MAIDLPRILTEKIALLDRRLAEAKLTRDSAATPTESASDKTRQNAEQLMDSLSDAKKRLELQKKSLKHLPPFTGLAALNSLVTLKTPLGNREYFLVPEGLGGQTIDDIFLLSVESPLAKSFLNQKPGYAFIFNGGGHQIVFVHPNS